MAYLLQDERRRCPGLAAVGVEDVDLLTFACRQRGLVHGIVHRLLQLPYFGAQREPTLRRQALAAAQAIRNRKTIAVLLEAWPSLVGE